MAIGKQFVQIVNEFCERNDKISFERKARTDIKVKKPTIIEVECTPEYIAYKSGYHNREKITDVFTFEKGTLSTEVMDRMISAMKKIEPGFQCDLKSKEGTKKVK